MRSPSYQIADFRPCAEASTYVAEGKFHDVSLSELGQALNRESFKTLELMSVATILARSPLCMISVDRSGAFAMSRVGDRRAAEQILCALLDAVKENRT